MIDVLNKPPTDPEEIALTAMVAAPDSYLEAVLEAAREGRAPPPAPLTGGGGSKIPERSRFLFSLEEERRPPNAGCWMLKELYYMMKTKFQQLCEGGEEFEGDD